MLAALIWPTVRFMFIDAVWDGSSRVDCLPETVGRPVGACWPFIAAKFAQFMYGFYPASEVWRVNLTYAIGLALLVPLLIPRVPYKGINALLFFGVFPVLAFFLLVGREARVCRHVETRQWGGLLVSLVITFTGIICSLPLGILLALGRRSSLPLLRGASVVFIEFWRGVPLITVLFFATYMLPFFLPANWKIDPLARVLIGVVIFAAAYMAEVVRGGLQAIPRGQYEAAMALGSRLLAHHDLRHPAAGAENRDPRHGQFLHRIVQGHDAGAHCRDLRPARAVARRLLRSELGDAGDRVHRICLRRHDLFRDILLHVALCAGHGTAAQYGCGAVTDAPQLPADGKSGGVARDIRTTRNAVAVDMDGVNKWFGAFHVLRDITLKVMRGERIVICGPSGSGKSTLLRCINRIEDWQQGRVTVDGVELTEDLKTIDEVRREVGMVFQQFNLFPHLTVLENCTLAPIWVRGQPRKEAEAIAHHYLERVRIPEQAKKYPAQLSGGQQQRVAIARALCMQPKIMLFDEATSALDPEMVKEVLDTMVELAMDGMTMLVVSHEMGFARQVATRMVLMDVGQIVEVDVPQQFFDHPQHERTKAFLSQILR